MARNASNACSLAVFHVLSLSPGGMGERLRPCRRLCLIAFPLFQLHNPAIVSSPQPSQPMPATHYHHLDGLGFR